MAEGLSDTRILLNALIPENCDCVEIKNLASAYDDSVKSGNITQNEAIIGFSERIDPDCRGKKPNTSPIVGCGSPELVCGHCKLARFLVEETLRLRGI